MQSAPRKRVTTPPMNMIYRFLSEGQRVQIWLFERQERIEGKLCGFDEYLNVVLDDCEEFDRKRGTRKSLGRILLKGENITLIRGILVK